MGYEVLIIISCPFLFSAMLFIVAADNGTDAFVGHIRKHK